MEQTKRHIPVLLQEVNEYLDIQPSDIVFDGTLGAGGHASSMIANLGSDGVFIGTDQDPSVFAETSARLHELFPDKNIITVCANFRTINTILAEKGIAHIDKALLDLGVSSMQLDEPEYGMTFRAEAPLTMVMSKTITEQTLTAFDVVNDWAEETLADIIYAFGDERYARRIAKKIIEVRDEQPIRTTTELAEVITSAVPHKYAHGPIHPATRTFQAIRIVVNDEYEALKQGLHATIGALAPGGRLAVISFHSGEDRIVKQIFKEYIDQDIVAKLHKKPLVPSDDEIKQNRRSRSSKLRVIEKI